MPLQEPNESSLVPFLPARRRGRHDDLAQAVLEQEPSVRRARERPSREVRRRPGTGQPLLAQRPDATAAVADLAREGDGEGIRVLVGTSGNRDGWG